MTFTIKIKTDNAAFQDNKEGEIRWILQDWIRRDILVDRRVMDSNGNTVGSITVKGK